ncbi:MAG: hypothetical protein IJ857_09860 [Lachnospiraceae bacterium]|nr:hypothetical protein [Lachnospiraceae bacterium]
MFRVLSEKCRQLSAVVAISLILTGTIEPVVVVFASENPSVSVNANESGGAGDGAGENSTFSETREIKNAEDLLLLSEKSRDESYTKGVRYVLSNDIDLADSAFTPISIFAGTFEGKGHVIKGLNITGRQYKTGFIRTVTEEGRIRDLKAEGTVWPSGEMSDIGGIAGENYGTIENCSFGGCVIGTERTGGIAGHNMESGRILGCVNTASVNAMRRTGGIAGFNEGLIGSSENRGEINAYKKTAHEINKGREEEEENTLDRLIPDTLDLKDDDLYEKYDNGLKVNYTGGIAGVCSGFITGSVNSGTVGCPHMGYKTGGITGYDRGIISGCRNTGTIYGRKDVGGIAGQYEPLAINIYSEDSLSKAGDALTDLSDRTEELHKSFGAEDDKAQANIDAVRNTSDALRQVIKDYKEYYRCKDDSVEREIRSRVDSIRSVTDSIDMGSYDRDTRDALQEIINSSDDINKLIDAAAEARGAGIQPDMTNYLTKISGMAGGLSASFDTLLSKAIDTNKDGRELKKDLERLRDESNSLDDYLRGCVDDYKKDFRITSDDVKGYVDRLSEETDRLFDGLKDSDSEIRKDVDQLISSLNVFNDSLSGGYREIQEELQKIYDTDGKEDVFEDLSDNPDDTLKKGVLSDCVNYGGIEADINGGGIAGVITDEYDPQSDFEVVSGGQISLNYDRYEKATILRCRNEGDVTVRNDCGGGIVGRADLGAVISSGNFGRVESTDGNYVGGIAGRSAFVIRDCNSMCEAVGSKYAGGIAGMAHSLVNNICLSAVDPEKEYHGAVAGDTDNADLNVKDKGSVSGNIFVFRGLGAINGVTDKSQAEAVSYSELLKREGVAEDFSEMTVTFKSDGRTVKRIRVPYGGRVSEEEYPPIEDNADGKFGYWEEKDLSRIEQNITVNAVFVDYVTTVAAGDPKQPDMIACGRFYDGTLLELKEEERNTGKAGDIYRAVSFSLDCSYGIPDNSSITVRYHIKDDRDRNAVVLLSDGSDHREAAVRTDGDYLVFDTEGGSEFYLSDSGEKRAFYVLPLIGVAILSVIAIIIVFLKKNRKKAIKNG